MDYDVYADILNISYDIKHFHELTHDYSVVITMITWDLNQLWTGPSNL